MRYRFLVPAILVVVTTGVFWGVRGHEFLNWDETIHITANQLFDPVTPSRLLRFWRAPFAGMYIPVVYTIWGVIAAFARSVPQPDGSLALNPHLFHTANLVAHLLNVLLVYAILRRLVAQPWAAGAGAGLFAIHPLQVEPVAWVAGMKDLSGGFFSLLALWFYLSYAQAEKRGRARLLYAAAGTAYVLALLAKPSSVAVPLMAFALDRWLLKRPARASLRALSPWLALAVPIHLLTRGEQWFAEPTPLWARPFVAGDALAFYLGKLAWPVGLAADYGRTPQWVTGHIWGYLTWLLPAGLALLAWRGRTRRSEVLAAGALFAAGLLPILGLVPFIFQQFSTVADRYAYLAMLGPALALAWLVRSARTSAVPATAGGALALLACLSAFQTVHWRNDTTFWTHTIEHNPKSWLAYNSLGLAMLGEGKPDEALAYYREALRARPDQAGSQVGIAQILETRGDLEGARREYEDALSHIPDYFPARLGLAGLLLRLGKPEEAAYHCRAALRTQPEDPAAHLTLAAALDAQGMAAEALPHAAAAVALQPRNPKAYFCLGTILLNDGRTAEAAAELRRAVQLDPRLAEAHANLAGALRKEGKPDEAIEEYRAALRLADFPLARYRLAELLEQRGQTTEALALYRGLLAEAPPDSPGRQDLLRAVTRLSKRAGPPQSR